MIFSIIDWFLYYLKCAYNIIYSYFVKINVKRVRNVKKINRYFYLIKLNGSYFDMGKEYGKSMGKILKHDVNKCLKFIKDNEMVFKRKIPNNLLNGDIFDSMIELYNNNSKFYNNDILDFIKGVSLGSGIKHKKLIYVNMFTDLMDNHCILLGKKIDDNILNLRTLDYGCPQMSHSLIVFKPSNKKSYLSLNLCFMFGLVTGISEDNIFFGESYYDDKIGKLSYIGTPFHHLSHKILSEANNLNEACKLLKNCNRTSNLQILLSDKNSSKIFLACEDKLELQQDGSMVYSVTPNEKNNFIKNFNYLDSLDNIIYNFIPKAKSGELHIMVVYGNKLYVSVTTNILQSYNNTFYEFNLVKLFKNK